MLTPELLERAAPLVQHEKGTVRVRRVPAPAATDIAWDTSEISAFDLFAFDFTKAIRGEIKVVILSSVKASGLSWVIRPVQPKEQSAARSRNLERLATETARAYKAAFVRNLFSMEDENTQRRRKRYRHKLNKAGRLIPPAIIATATRPAELSALAACEPLEQLYDAIQAEM